MTGPRERRKREAMTDTECALTLTRQMVEGLSLAAVVDYRTCREEQGMTHEEAVEQVIEQASESYECLAGECMH